MILKEGNGQLGQIVKRMVIHKVSKDISKNFRKLDTTQIEALTRSLKSKFFRRRIWGGATVASDEYLSSNEGNKDLSDHLEGRLNEFRQTVIPWLSDAKPLSGTNILEIGCGTGSSTVALAEQGANVTAIDIDAASLTVAKDRCQLYGLKVDFVNNNAVAVGQIFADQHFDLIIFFAALEHMHFKERIAAIKSTWDMLSMNDLWCVIDTPNRLWYFDDHTAQLPFFHWLPDDLAFAYSRFSPRKPFCQAYREQSEETTANFLRHGRGVSFHEFDIAIGKTEELEIVSTLPRYLRKQSHILALSWQMTVQHGYENFLAKVGPKVNKAFYEAYLNFIIRKNQ